MPTHDQSTATMNLSAVPVAHEYPAKPQPLPTPQPKPGAHHSDGYRRSATKKTEVCRHWARGFCNRGFTCGFAHTSSGPGDGGGDMLKREGSNKMSSEETTSDGSADAVVKQRVPCKDHAAGKCHRGARCKFVHVAQNSNSGPHAPMPTPACRDFAAGTCTRTECRYLHEYVERSNSSSNINANAAAGRPVRGTPPVQPLSEPMLAASQSFMSSEESTWSVGGMSPQYTPDSGVGAVAPYAVPPCGLPQAPPRAYAQVPYEMAQVPPGPGVCVVAPGQQYVMQAPPAPAAYYTPPQQELVLPTDQTNVIKPLGAAPNPRAQPYTPAVKVDYCNKSYAAHPYDAFRTSTSDLAAADTSVSSMGATHNPYADYPPPGAGEVTVAAPGGMMTHQPYA